jgi:cytochrome c
MKQINWRYLLGAAICAILVVGAINLFGNTQAPPPQETAENQVGQTADPVAIKDIGAGETASVAAATSESFLTSLRSGDAEAGRKLARKCAACHNFIPGGGPRRVGPHLWNIVDAPKARIESYPYSQALRQAGGTWTLAELDSFLANPRQALPKTRMKFAGLKNARERADILLFLRGLSNSPLSLPDPS